MDIAGQAGAAVSGAAVWDWALSVIKSSGVDSDQPASASGSPKVKHKAARRVNSRLNASRIPIRTATH
jgi:hypothetical protein